MPVYVLFVAFKNTTNNFRPHCTFLSSRQIDTTRSCDRFKREYKIISRIDVQNLLAEVRRSGCCRRAHFYVHLVVSLEIPVEIQFTLRSPSPSPSPSPSISSTLPRVYDYLWSSGVVCCFLLIPSLPSSHHIMQRAFASAPRAALRSSRVNAGSLTQQRFAHKVRRHQLDQEYAQDGY